MKKLLLIFTVLFFSLNSLFAQGYVPFPTQAGAQWVEEYMFLSSMPIQCDRRIYTILKDTILNTLTYQLIQEK